MIKVYDEIHKRMQELKPMLAEQNAANPNHPDVDYLEGLIDAYEMCLNIIGLVALDKLKEGKEQA